MLPVRSPSSGSLADPVKSTIVPEAKLDPLAGLETETSGGWLVEGAGDATVDGVTFSQDQGNTYSKASAGGSTRRQFVDPIDVDASATQVKVTVLS